MVDVVTNHMGYDGCQTCVDYSVFNPFNEVIIVGCIPHKSSKLIPTRNPITIPLATSTIAILALFRYAGKVITLSRYQIYEPKMMMSRAFGTLGSPN